LVRLVQPRTEWAGDSYTAVVASSYALTKIADGETLGEALRKIPADKPTATKDVVIRVYRDFAGLSEVELDVRPSPGDQRRAERYVDGLVDDAGFFE